MPTERSVLEELAQEFEQVRATEWEKREEVRTDEAADRESGKLPADSGYEATWNYHEGLSIGAGRAARLVRDRLASLPSEPQGDGMELT